MSPRNRNKQSHPSKPAPRGPLPKAIWFALGFGAGGVVFAVLALVAGAQLRTLFAGLGAFLIGLVPPLLLFAPLLGSWGSLGNAIFTLFQSRRKSSYTFRSQEFSHTKPSADQGWWALLKLILWLLSGIGTVILLFLVLKGS